MRRSFKNALLLSSAAFVVVLAPDAALAQSTGATPQAAPEADQTQSGGLTDIVVTARRVTESAQRTPVSITAFSADDLASRVVQRPEDLAKSTPSLLVNRNSSSPSGVFLAIRGQAQTESSAYAPGSVGVYFDDVYIGGAMIAGGLLNTNDSERVEVLKGPQGTLYGRNVTAGLIKFVSQKPKDKFEGYATGGYGNYGRTYLDGMLNVPLATDVALRLNASFDRHGGYSKDINNGGADTDSDRRWNVRGALRINATSNLQFLLQGWYGKDKAGPIDIRTLYVDPTNATAIKNIIATQHLSSLTNAQISALSTTSSDYLALRTQALALVDAYANAPRDQARLPVYPVAADVPPIGSNAKLAGGAFTGTLNLGEVTLKSVTAYSYAFRNSQNSLGGGPFAVLYTNQGGSVSQWSQEVQATGSAFDGRLKFAAGVYYIDQTIEDFRRDSNEYGAYPLYLGNLGGLGATNGTRSENTLRVKSWAPYGQASFEIVHGLNLTGGLRYTDERVSIRTQQYDVNGRNRVPGTCRAPAPATAATPLDQCFGTASVKFNNLSYSVGADWLVEPDVMLYAKRSRGFRSGGLNPFSTAFLPVVSYKSEVNLEHEIGLKSQFFDRHAQLNLAYFHTKYSNIQRNVSTVFSPGPPPVLATGTQNAAAATIQGVEGDLTVAPVSGLRLSATAAYTDPKYDSYSVFSSTYPNNLQDLSSEAFQYVPKWQYSFSASYERPVNFGSIRGSLNWSGKSSAVLFAHDVVAAAPGGPTAPLSVLTQKAYGLLDGSLIFSLEKLNASVTLWGKNILNKRYKEAVVSLVTVGNGYSWASYGPPATYGIDVTLKF